MSPQREYTFKGIFCPVRKGHNHGGKGIAYAGVTAHMHRCCSTIADIDKMKEDAVKKNPQQVLQGCSLSLTVSPLRHFLARNKWIFAFAVGTQ